MDATEVIYEGELGSVHSSTDAAVYLPASMEMSKHKAIPQGISKSLETPKAAIRIAAEPAAARSHADRAMLLAVLKEKLPAFPFRHADAAIESPQTARIPVQVAARGQTPVACYLAVHGFRDKQIAELLGIEESAVSESIEGVMERAR
jgi:hypothetical protein